MVNSSTRRFKIILTFVLAGFVVFIFNFFSDYYYYDLAGRENCNEGIGFCYLGFFEMLVIQITGWFLSFVIIFVVLGKLKVRRRWFLLILSLITLLVVQIVLNETNVSFPFGSDSILSYPLVFGLYYVIFSEKIPAS